MRHAFAHEAVLDMDPDEDLQAPGAAVTAALCGHWDHQSPCPLAPHHSRADRVDGEVRLRILFASAPDAEVDVRQRITAALSGGELTGPRGVVTRWQLRDSRPGELTSAEADHAERLIGT
jgi:hypothetical protein